eukprot:09489.XXX_93525_93853_1 [CDS] Oithona nana genome sequencing.
MNSGLIVLLAIVALVIHVICSIYCFKYIFACWCASKNFHEDQLFVHNDDYKIPIPEETTINRGVGDQQECLTTNSSLLTVNQTPP